MPSTRKKGSLGRVNLPQEEFLLNKTSINSMFRTTLS
jgi:hypothetical protein